MPYVRRNADGRVESLHRSATESAEFLPDDHAELRAFLGLQPEVSATEQFARLDAESDETRFADLAHLLFGQATLAEGGTLEDPATFVKRLNGLLLNWYEGEAGHYIGKHRDSDTKETAHDEIAHADRHSTASTRHAGPAGAAGRVTALNPFRGRWCAGWWSRGAG